MLKKIILSACFALAISGLRAQDKDSNLLNILNDSIAGQEKADTRVRSIFKATQIVNLPTVEQPGKKNLQFMIMHRFGKVNGGAYELFGLDNATIRFGLDYGITNRLSVGVGRSSLNKTFDGSLKYIIAYQNKESMPVAISIYGVATTQTLKYTDKPYLDFSYRTAYTTQLLIARKFSERLSLELVPSWVHYNLVPTLADKNDIFLLSAGGRMKITKRVSVNAEYNYITGNPLPSQDLHSSLSMGVDIETGGHVFQLVFSNSQGMVGPAYLTQTNGTWNNGDIYFGFNITRAFGWNKHKHKTN
ncbi:hypothetical protein SAMN05660909_01102 [Chitinophaga terrae (ex Kim and Jung 2007)]|uniref:DUF5777 domain-containing protein n=1 Tax=Chitinophaga terrae (ex Kim and Jung 2007) TaxID=408074 RepID=A0A1H3Z9U3_9BACT|nr:DUF5777 family beta-barrel protein [Chitinophaga terrae (ex Kim and Jung 2007)]GEP88632.1 hypothetical protein CTE07_02770 [Chitinophaga terrae (ex Kim and Jung 2007)]SEA20134.1 hypothetical protein SAMN05660909_01102 [Chitinophaga terrae (ex Kim and Jung 2007)]